MYGESDYGSTDYGNVRHFSNAFILNLVDTVTGTDLISKLRSYFRTLTDSKTLSDTIKKSPIRILRDSFSGLIDIDIDTIKSRGLEYIDGINLSDIFKKFTTKVLNDIGNLTDYISHIYKRFINFVDSFSGLSDLIATSYQRHLNRFDNANLTDTIKKSSTRNFIDSITTSDLFSKLRRYFKSLSDSSTLSDLLSKTRANIFNDSISLLDFIRKVLNGLIISPWVKMAKASVETWDKVARATTETWNKTAKAVSDIWIKKDKPE